MGAARFPGPLHRQLLETSGLERLQSSVINPELEASEVMDGLWVEFLICALFKFEIHQF